VASVTSPETRAPTQSTMAVCIVLVRNECEEMLCLPTILLGRCERRYRCKVVLDHLDNNVHNCGCTGGGYLRAVEVTKCSIIHDARAIEEGREGLEGIRGGIRNPLTLR
jgi:hypothetical protein